MNVGEHLQELLATKTFWTFMLFGHKVAIIDAVVFCWATTIILIVAAFFLTRNLSVIPGKKQVLLEMIVNFINGMAEQWLGHYGKKFAPWYGSIMLFLLLANLLPLFNFIPGVEIAMPTKNINVTATMAVVSILIVIFSGIILRGPKHFLRTFIEPSPIMLPFKIMDYVTRPVSLALRLFGNMLGGFIIMELIYLIVPLFIPAVFSVYFDLFDGVMQAYIFSYLSMIYVAEVVE